MNSHSNKDSCLELLREKERSFDWKLTLFAMCISLGFHILIFLSIPKDFLVASVEEDRYEDLELEILPPPVEMRQLPQYIEANPYANEDKPKDNATKESFQNQRAADMIVDVNSDSDKPYVEGELPDSQKIVSGNNEDKPSSTEAMEITEITDRQLAPPNIKNISSEDLKKQTKPSQTKKIQNETTEDSDFTGESQAIKSKEQISPIKGEEIKISTQEEGKSAYDNLFTAEELVEDGDIKIYETYLKNFKDDKTRTKEIGDIYAIKGDAKEDVSTQISQANPAQEEAKKEALPTPRKRPSINMKITAGPLVDNNRRASELGVLAVDSRFSEFGAYQQRMIEAISRQWNLLANKYTLSSIVNTVVTVEFYLNKEGYLTSFRILYSNSSSLGITLCEQSIKTTSPYGDWTEDMIAVFGGNNQAVKINFHYR